MLIIHADQLEIYYLKGRTEFKVCNSQGVGDDLTLSEFDIVTRKKQYTVKLLSHLINKYILIEKIIKVCWTISRDFDLTVLHRTPFVLNLNY